MSPPKDPTSFNLPDRKTLDNVDIGSLGLAVLTLTRELWVLTDRIHVLEAVLAKHDLDIREEVKNFQPDDKMTAELRQESTALIERVLGSLAKD